MKTLLTTAVTLFSLQSYAAVSILNNSIPHSIQESLTRPAHLFYWNEGAWIDSVKFPCAISEEAKTEILSKSPEEWTNIMMKGGDKALEAKSALGVASLNGIGTHQNEEWGLILLKDAAKNGRFNSALHTGIAYACGTGNLTIDYVEALNWYKLADKLNKTGENKFSLGGIYTQAAEQATVRKNYKKAVEIHKEALEYGNTASAANLVAHYLTGLGVDKDAEEALEYAKLVDTKSMFKDEQDYYDFGNKLTPETIVGLIGLNTSNLDKDTYVRDYYNAMFALNKAVEKGDPIGAYIAAKTAYAVRDYNYYSYALNVAVDNGLPVAQYELANVLSKNNKPEEALELYKDAAESGYESAFNKYGIALYDKGNHKDSLEWLIKAVEYEGTKSEIGDTPIRDKSTDAYIESTKRLAQLYVDGEGIEHNMDKAKELVDEVLTQALVRTKSSKFLAGKPNILKNFNTEEEAKAYYEKKSGYFLDMHSELVKLKDRIKGK